MMIYTVEVENLKRSD